MTKPTISEIEANWNIHLAGLTAEKAAREKGVSEADGNTLLDAAIGGKIIAGIKFPPIHAGFMLMLSHVERLEESKAYFTSEMDNYAALAFILQAPQIAWPMLKVSAGKLFIEAVIDFAQHFTLPQLQELMAWVNEEMARLKSQGESVGKPAAE